MPDCAISYLNTITLGGTRELVNHKNIDLIINTGIPSILNEIEKTGKPFIYGGSGNGPVFIERTANIKRAVSDIILSKTFDNGIVSAAEQSIVVDKQIEQEVQNEFERQGAFFMTEEQSKRLGKIIFNSNKEINPEMVGKDATHLMKVLNIKTDKHIKILISKQKYVTSNNIYTKEILCPVLGYYVEQDWVDACEKCIELLLNEGYGHTLVIHSNNGEVLKQFAIKKPVGRMLINIPASLGGIGMTTNLFPAMTLGSGIANIGITSDNVSPMNLIYKRKVGYGVRDYKQSEEDNNLHIEKNNDLHMTNRLNINDNDVNVKSQRNTPNDVYTLEDLRELKEILDFALE